LGLKEKFESCSLKMRLLLNGSAKDAQLEKTNPGEPSQQRTRAIMEKREKQNQLAGFTPRKTSGVAKKRRK